MIPWNNSDINHIPQQESRATHILTDALFPNSELWHSVDEIFHSGEEQFQQPVTHRWSHFLQTQPFGSLSSHHNRWLWSSNSLTGCIYRSKCRMHLKKSHTSHTSISSEPIANSRHLYLISQVRNSQHTNRSVNEWWYWCHTQKGDGQGFELSFNPLMLRHCE